jgi:hypothetical protein
MVPKNYTRNVLREHLTRLKVDPYAIDLMEKILVLDPKKRIGAIEAAQVRVDPPSSPGFAMVLPRLAPFRGFVMVLPRLAPFRAVEDRRRGFQRPSAQQEFCWDGSE